MYIYHVTSNSVIAIEQAMKDNIKTRERGLYFTVRNSLLGKPRQSSGRKPAFGDNIKNICLNGGSQQGVLMSLGVLCFFCSLEAQSEIR